MTAVSSEALLNTAMDAIKEIGRGFKEPADTWQPVALVALRDGNVATIDLQKLPTQFWGLSVAMVLAQMDGARVLTIAEGWTNELEEEELGEAIQAGVPPDELPGACEALVIVIMEHGLQTVYRLPIVRMDPHPPIIGKLMLWGKTTSEASSMGTWLPVIMTLEAMEDDE